jgi:phosphoribosyl 1,2-cyclic phosphodiesterase
LAVKVSDLAIKFWGVRGSIPTPCQENVGFGGNTACIEIRHAGQTIVIDGGTGVRNLGIYLEKSFLSTEVQLHLLLTHFHWDHVQGLPFFAPLYHPASEVTFYSGRPAEELSGILEGQMSAPYFPVRFEFLAAKRKFVELRKGGEHAGRAVVHPFPLNHPQGATGFRVELDGSVITHASDVEHGHPSLDTTLREYAQNADVLIYDAQYTPEEYELRKGWGHSTWLEAAQIARECKVKRLILFHHDPSHDDEYLVQLEADARRRFEKTDAAKEGWEIVV